MKRAASSIRPSLRPPRRPGRITFVNNFQRARNSSNWNRFPRLFSSITFDGGDSGFHVELPSHDDNRNARSAHRERRTARRARAQPKQVKDAQQYLDNATTSSMSSDPSIFSNIQDAQDSMQDLLDRLVEINRTVPISCRMDPITVHALAGDESFDLDFDLDAAKKKGAIFYEAGEFLDVLVRSVEEGLLNPSRKHGKELSQLAECLLYVCSQQQPLHDSLSTENEEPKRLDASEVLGAIEEVLRVLEVDWNLDVSHRHYEQAIEAACNWREWAVASDLFDKQIDPNAGGSPVRMSVENPLALFAMTQRYQPNVVVEDPAGDESASSSDGQEATAIHEPLNQASGANRNAMVAEHVMDAVQRLVMVSPQDQTTYVLAAGNALGHAGCWRELNDYRKSSFLSQQYGTPLVAAVLRACLLCGEYDAALDILVEEGILSPSVLTAEDEEETAIDPFFANSSSSSSSSSRSSKPEEEWQWGGARDRMDPLIRDLAMQVIGGALALAPPGDGINETEDNVASAFCNSRLALELFRQSREEGVTISREALLGVVEACERDKDWRGALSVLRTVLEEEQFHSSGDLKVAPWIVPGERLTIAERDQLVTVDIEGPGTDLPYLGPVLASFMRNCNSSSNFGLALFGQQLFRTQMLQSLSTTDDFKRTDIDSSSPEEDILQMLSTMISAGAPPQDHEELLIASMVSLSGLRCHKNVMNLYERTTGEAESRMNSESSSASLLYQYASRNQTRHGTLVLGNPWLSAHNHIDRLTQAGALVRSILQGTTNSAGNLQKRQREGTEEILARAMNSCTSAHQPELSLYLLEWMEDSAFSHRGNSPALWTHSANPSENSAELDDYRDSVTAERILALRWTKDLTGAIELFEQTLEQHSEDDLVQWRKTIVAGLTAMVANGRGNDAVKVFEVLDRDVRSTASYTTIGRHLCKVKDWKELIDLYRDATADGYSSEELGLLAMQAVTSTRVDNRLRILRAIVNECATSVGLDPKRWTMTKYWQLKRTLGFYHARLLMWWNDERRAPLDEVNLAIKEFYNETANGMRPKNDVVRAIFTGASNHDSLRLEQLEGGYEKVPRSVDEWAELLGKVLRTVEESPVRYDPNFVDGVVRAYKSLGKNKECVRYVSDVLEVDGTRIRKSTLEDVLEAAETEGAFDVYSNIEMMLTRGRSTTVANAEDSPSMQTS